MINKVYVSTADASLIRSAQTIAISQLGFKWIMGPVNEMTTVKTISASKWAYMVLDGNSGAIFTSNSGPSVGSRTSAVATSISTITEAFAPATPLVPPPVPPPFVLSFTAFINATTSSTVAATAPVTAAFTGTNTYNGGGTVTGLWNLGDGTAVTPYTSSTVVSHTYQTGSFTASLALTESAYNSKSVATVYVTANVPTVTPRFTIDVATATAPYTASFTNISSLDLGYGATVTYKWIFGDGATTSSIDSTHGYQTGSFPVQLQITESIYGIASAYILPDGITGSVPVLTPLFYVITSSAVAPLTAAFANSSSEDIGDGVGYGFRWVFGDGTTSTAYQPSVIYNTGSFVVRLELSESAYGIASAYTLPGGITGSVPTLVATFTTNSVGFGETPESFMEPLTMSFTSSVDTYTGHSGLTYSWSFGNGNSSLNEPPPQANYLSGAYTASLTVTETSYGISSTSAQSFIVGS